LAISVTPNRFYLYGNRIQDKYHNFAYFLPSFRGERINNAKINQATDAELKQAVGSHEDQYNNTPQKEAYPAGCYIAMFKG
jgi:hypothetical protein